MRGEFVDVGGIRIYYYAAGTRGAGAPVVFLHGFPGSSHGWRLIVPLMPDGRRLVVPDLVGAGRSDGPGEAGGDLAGHTRVMLGLLDDLQVERAAIVGHGFGGAIAQSLAVHHPDRVAALCLMGTPAFDAWPRTLARLARAAAPAGRLLGASVLASFAHGSALRGFVDRDAGRRSLDVSLRASALRLGVDAIRAHLTALRDPGVAALAPSLGRIGVPTAVVWGADDPFLPSAVGARLRDAIPGATLDVIAGARHYVAEDSPQECARVIGALLSR